MIPPADRLRAQGLRLFGMNLLGQISIKPHLLNGAQLGLEPIDMLFGIDDHFLQPMPSREIADLRAMGNSVTKDFRVVTLEGQIALQQIRYFLSGRNRVQMIYFGCTA